MVGWLNRGLKRVDWGLDGDIDVVGDKNGMVEK